MPHSAHEKFLPMYNLQQQYIEKHLWEAAAESDLIEIRWESEVTGVENEDDDATLRKEPLAAYKMAATYVLAADGARSAMRSMLGLRLQGGISKGTTLSPTSAWTTITQPKDAPYSHRIGSARNGSHP